MVVREGTILKGGIKMEGTILKSFTDLIFNRIYPEVSENLREKLQNKIPDLSDKLDESFCLSRCWDD